MGHSVAHQALPLASLAGRFSQNHRDDPDDPIHFACHVWFNGAESIAHLKCETHCALGKNLFIDLDDANCTGEVGTNKCFACG